MNTRVVPLSRDADTTLPAHRHAGLNMGAWFVETGRLSPPEAERIHAHQSKTGQLYGEAGIEMGLLAPQDVLGALAVQFGHVHLPRNAGLGSELLAAWQPDHPTVETLRTLRSQLMLRWFENDARHAALAVVSPGRHEGRSFISANLAVLFSQLGRRTLVIDANLRDPRQHRIFGMTGRIGLSAILAGRAGIEAVVDLPVLPGLSLLPAGTQPPNPQELLARPDFSRLLSALRSSFDVILVDTPAYGDCSESGTIAARCGAAMVVACRDSSSMPQIAQVTGSLREFGVTLVGAVLNAPGHSS